MATPTSSWLEEALSTPRDFLRLMTKTSSSPSRTVPSVEVLRSDSEEA